ncbi:MAG: hypothetical protein E7453_05795 [Ruminococcaceae bacterium]|nr:hypothetical protein [Oscillospiraceae bacterium]
MAYKIDYIPVGKRQYAKRIIPRWLFPTALIFSLSSVILALTIHHGSADWLLPGDPAVTKVALLELIENLKAGEQFSDAVAAFCQEVIKGAA